MVSYLSFLVTLLISVLAQQKMDKVEYNMSTLDSAIVDLHFCGKNDEVILALTQNNLVYRSETDGMTWKKLTEILERTAQTTLVKEQNEMGKVVRFEESEADQNLLAMIGSHGVNWYSDDCGKTLKALNHGRPIYEFQFHPRVREWGLAAAWTQCSDFQKTPCKIYKELYLTKNLGESWDFVTNYVVQFSWAQMGLTKAVQKQVKNERIYVTRLPNGKGHQEISGWTSDVDFQKSDDFFKTTQTLVARGNKFIMADTYIFIAQVIEEGSSEVNLLISNSLNIEKFHKAEIPVKRIPEHSYTLLDTSEGSIFLHVNHYGDESRYGNIYISDSTGIRFSLSLLHNVRNPKGTADFDKVYGLEGIYIANIFDKEISTQGIEGFKATNKKIAANKNTPETAYKKTVITFDKGGEWQSLTPPEKDAQGQRIRCQDDECSLHLHSLSFQQYGPFYSSENAVGVVIGTGNVGYHLSHQASEINTYVSRDGGLNWFEVRKGSNIYEIGDHGALIVMADDQTETDSILFTWNEGMTWEKLKVSEEPIEVDNIVIEPTATSQKFILYGTKDEKGIIIALDFSSLHEPICNNPDAPDTPNSDYESWTPNDGRNGSKCLMGHITTYTRKKRESECFNGEIFERQQLQQNCECTEKDFECDINYYRDTNTDKCVRVEESAIIEMEDTCETQETYTVPTGYRRVAGNTCSGGVASYLDASLHHCQTSFGTAIYWLIAFGFAGALGYLIYTQRDKYEDFIATLILKNEQYRYGNLDRVPECAEDDDENRQSGALLDDFDPRD